MFSAGQARSRVSVSSQEHLGFRSDNLKTLPCLVSFIMFRGRGLEARLSLGDVCHCIDGYESVRNKNSETISLLTTSS